MLVKVMNKLNKSTNLRKCTIVTTATVDSSSRMWNIGSMLMDNWKCTIVGTVLKFAAQQLTIIRDLYGDLYWSIAAISNVAVHV